MDHRLTKALAVGEYAATQKTQKVVARYKLADDLLYATEGGIFEITKELISFVVSLKVLGKKESVILDRFENPILIEIDKFCDEIVERYHTAHFSYLTTMEKLRRARSVEAVIANA